MSTPLSRRQLLTATISGAAAFAIAGRAQQKNWQAGAVRHLLPGVSHDRLLLKASFVRPMTAPPTLRAGTRKAPGVRLDAAGEFYSFDLAGLEPEHTYQLVLEDAAGKPSATRGRFRHFPVLEPRRKDSGCSCIPAQAGILRRSTPTRIVRTGCRLPTGENCF